MTRQTDDQSDSPERAATHADEDQSDSPGRTAPPDDDDPPRSAERADSRALAGLLVGAAR